MLRSLLRHCIPASAAVVMCGFVPSAHEVVAQQIVAHRGASADAPENTLAAFQLAWEQGSDAVEGDFYLTTDRQIVAIHDKSTERTSGVDLDVRKHTLARLKSLDVGKWKAGRFVGERIPTLKQVCRTIPPEGKLVLEVKDSPRIVPVIVQAIRKTPEFATLLPGRLVIISFDEHVVAACKQSLPDVKALWLTGFKADERTGELTPSIGSILGTLARIQADGLDCKASEHIDPAFVQQLRNAGYEFHVWTVDEPEMAARFQRLGVDSITTNRPAFIRESLMLQPVSVP
ncbi:MAG: glycerophosphodiester phosphodiesterase [Planctomycetaceae bacterium]